MQILLRRIGSSHAATLWRMQNVYGSNESRRAAMDYDVDGLERTINAFETTFAGIRLHVTVPPRNRSSGPRCVFRIISQQGNDEHPLHDEVPKFGDHENVSVTTCTPKRADNVTKDRKKRTVQTHDPRVQQKLKGVRHRGQKKRRALTKTTNNAWSETSRETFTVTMRKAMKKRSKRS